MMTEEAEVVAIDGDHAWVEAQRRTACGACTASKGCGTGLIARFFSGREVRLRAANPIAAEVGERVVVAVAEDVLLRSSLMAYILPLITLFIGAILGQEIQYALFDPAGEGIVVLGGLLGFGLGVLGLRAFARRVERDDRYEPRIVERLVPSAAPVWPIRHGTPD